MSNALPLHTGRKADYKETIRLIVPFSSSAGAQRRLKRRPRREASEHPVWELLRSGKVKAVKDVSGLLHP